jgi:hypothetical protein
MEIRDHPILIINLVRRPERKQQAIEEMIKMNITQYEFVEAVDGCLYTLPNPRQYWTSGAYGLNLTLQKVLKRAIQEKWEYFTFLEDEVDFSPSICLSIPIGFKAFYLGGTKRPESIYTPTAYPTIFEIQRIYATHSIVLHSSIYQELLEIIEKNIPIDDAFVQIQLNGGVFGYKPMMTKQKVGYSDIANKMITSETRKTLYD